MKTWLTICSVLLALLIAGAWWARTNAQDDGASPPLKTVLQDDINACDTIAEKSAMHLQAVVETQKLEIIGRKAHVFRRCMADRAYAENPAWAKYAMPVAEKTAKKTLISIDEAFENLRRKEMVQLSPAQGVPVFWVTKQKTSAQAQP